MFCCCWRHVFDGVTVDRLVVAVWCPLNLRQLPGRPLHLWGDRGLMVAESMDGNNWPYSLDPGVLLLMIDCFVDWFVPSSDVLA